MIVGYAIPAVQKFQGAAYKSLYYQALENSKADGATPDDNPCLIARGDELYRAGGGAVPSVLIVPQFVKPGAVYTQIPTPTVEAGDFDQFTFTRNTTATRVNASGLIESVASGVLRLDYPVTGGCPAALIEPSAQNLVLQSEAWNVSPWAATSGSQGATVSGNVTASPDGTTNADKLIESAVTGTHFCLQTLTLTSGTTYTASCFVKASERTRGRLRTSGAGAYWDLDFNLTSGTVTGGTNPFIQNYGNGWYRIGATFTANQASNNFILFLLDASGNVSYTGDGTSGIFVWGAQIETGAIPTSYIPTTTASATRAAEVCTVSGVSGYIGQTQGTLYLDLSYEQGSSTSNRWLELFGNSNHIALAVNSNNNIRSIVNGQSDVLTGTDTRSRYKIAWGYDLSGVVCFINGTQFTLTNGGAQVITSLDSFRIDMSSTAGQRVFNNRLRAAAIYTTRLSNDQLANLTRLT